MLHYDSFRRLFLYLMINIILSTIKSTLNLTREWDCNRTWPQLELFLPVCLTRTDIMRHYEVEIFFLRSLFLFWPLQLSNTSLLAVVDGETYGNAKYNELQLTLKGIENKIPGGIRLATSPPSDYYSSGYNRQQLMMFWADNFTTSEYVGFVDTDCVFLTYVDREDLFEDGKPVVNGHMGRTDNPFWIDAINTTYYAVGVKEPMRCMTYFPVIVKTSHLKDMRDHMSKVHNKPFNEVFRDIIQSDAYSQFNLMCAYLFYFKKNDYKWYVHTADPNWDGVHPPPHKGQNADLSLYEQSMFFPKHRIATHARYRRNSQLSIYKNSNHLNILFQRGFCMSPPFPHNEQCCNNTISKIHRLGYFDEMHRFEYFDWTHPSLNNDELLRLAFSDRHQRIINCSHEYDPLEYEKITSTEDNF